MYKRQNINYAVTPLMLKKYFETIGPVRDYKILIDPNTGHSKGCGFIIMDNIANAKKALMAFDKKDFEGRTLRIEYARPRGNRNNVWSD